MLNQLLNRYSPFATAYSSFCNTFKALKSSKNAVGGNLVVRNCTEFQECMFVDTFAVVKDDSCVERSVELESDKSAASRPTTAVKKAASLAPYNPYAGTTNEIGPDLDILDLFFVDIVCIDYESDSVDSTDIEDFYDAPAAPSLAKTAGDKELDEFISVTSPVYDPFYGVFNEHLLDPANSFDCLDKSSTATEISSSGLFVDSSVFAATARALSSLAGYNDLYAATARAFSLLVCFYASQASISTDSPKQVGMRFHFKKPSIATGFDCFVDNPIYSLAARSLASLVGYFNHSAHRGSDPVAAHDNEDFVDVGKPSLTHSTLGDAVSASLTNCNPNDGCFNGNYKIFCSWWGYESNQFVCLDEDYDNPTPTTANDTDNVMNTSTTSLNITSGFISGPLPILAGIDEEFFTVKSEEYALDKQLVGDTDSVIVDHEDFFFDFESESDYSTDSDNYYDIPVAPSLITTGISDDLDGFVDVANPVYDPFYVAPTTKRSLDCTDPALGLENTSVAVEIASSGLFVDASVFAFTARAFSSLTGYHSLCVAQTPAVTEFGCFVDKSVFTAAACTLTSLAGYFSRSTLQNYASVTVNEIDDDFVVVDKPDLIHSALGSFVSP
ncbi:hypothetical protein [Parasitella parasitica]|uniref:Uncharacterized protein n=1 Tax=Parasitella parasitica TaxID=35722 RepID=A0A0B7NF91_9FUNG|nr:hypothetical protein [Parasitella parasitica]